MAHGFDGSPVSSTTAADVSSQDVSIPRMRMPSDRSRGERRSQRFRVWRAEYAALGDDGGNQLVRRDVECRVAHERAGRRQLTATEMGHFFFIALLDRNPGSIRRLEVDGRERRGDVKGDA